MDPLTGIMIGTQAVGLANSLFGADQNRKAANAAADAAREANALTEAERRRNEERMRPYVEGGQADYGTLRGMLGQPFAMEAPSVLDYLRNANLDLGALSPSAPAAPVPSDPSFWRGNGESTVFDAAKFDEATRRYEKDRAAFESSAESPLQQLEGKSPSEQLAILDAVFSKQGPEVRARYLEEVRKPYELAGGGYERTKEGYDAAAGKQAPGYTPFRSFEYGGRLPDAPTLERFSYGGAVPTYSGPRSFQYGDEVPEFSEMSYEDLEKDPGYRFRMAEGQRTLEGSRAAGGGYFSGRTLRDLTDYAQGRASDEFDRAYGRHVDAYQFGRDEESERRRRAAEDWQRDYDVGERGYERRAAIEAENRRRAGEDWQRGYNTTLDQYNVEREREAEGRARTIQDWQLAYAQDADRQNAEYGRWADNYNRLASLTGQGQVAATQVGAWGNQAAADIGANTRWAGGIKANATAQNAQNMMDLSGDIIGGASYYAANAKKTPNAPTFYP